MTQTDDTKRPTTRQTLNRTAVAFCLGVGLTTWVIGGADDDTPIGGKWWPSEYGAEDQRGAANRITPEKVLEARDLIQTGKIYQLGRLYEHGMPIPGKRHFSLTIPGLPTGLPTGNNQMVSNDELVSGEIGQVGTQFDGLGHVGCRVNGEDIFYNGFKLSEFGDPYGLKKLGVENVGVFLTRGILLDVAAVRNADRLPNGYVIKPAELQACLDAADLQIHPGDIVLIRTGHGKLWMEDNETYAEGEPGIGLAAAKFLTDRKVSLIGADTWAIEAVPHESDELSYPVHQWNLTRHGVYHLENLDLEELAADKVVEFAFMFSPLRLRGATGSPGNPIAVK
ncbi:MAG: cyclase family protein [Planctomycetota bacterium]|nr:cyclase family protein [Planctomycetota bacterium]